MNYVNIKWNKKIYLEFIKKLEDMRDVQYKEFHEKIVAYEGEVIGIRSPIIKGVAKEIAKGDWRGFLAQEKGKYYEETVIRGLVIGFIKEDKEIVKKEIEKFITEINNWGVCDSFISNLKIIKKNKEYFFPLVKLMGESNNQWEIRFSLVCLLSYYIEKEYLEEIFKICSGVKNKEYYVQMAQGWLISVLFVKFRDETLEYLKNNTLDSWVQNKGIQKIRESYRVSDEDKELVKQFKK